MLCLRLDCKKSEAFIGIVLTDAYLFVDSDICSCPTVAVGYFIQQRIKGIPIRGYCHTLAVRPLHSRSKDIRPRLVPHKERAVVQP